EIPGGPVIGGRFGSYEVLDLVGEGGMGAVYRARSADGATVALKVIKPAFGHDEMFRRRFTREARSAAKVQHPHVVALIDAGEIDGVAYLAEGYVRGESLEGRLRREGPLPLDDIVTMCLQVASGLDALHAAGIVHRDLKPANILLDEDGAAFITDFGLAKDSQASVLTRVGSTVGTADYMAPEQIRGGQVTAATDVYALGCVVSECLRGEPPFADRQGMQIFWAHLRDDAPDPCAARDDVAPDVSWAVLQALAKEPSRRPPTATAYARMLQMAAAARPSR
ncbi:MAG TPA: serine/threonine-protein kinase, partial [Solirubrobacteraceae bacterium]